MLHSAYPQSGSSRLIVPFDFLSVFFHHHLHLFISENLLHGQIRGAVRVPNAGLVCVDRSVKNFDLGLHLRRRHTLQYSRLLHAHLGASGPNFGTLM